MRVPERGLLDNKKKIHFVGVGGAGMSGLAKYLSQYGYEVSGSDLKAAEKMECLRAKGVRVFSGHAAENVNGAELIVYSSAIGADNPEMLQARARNIPIIHRAQMLAYLVNSRKSVGILGTHGKTTTTSLVSFLMNSLDLNPTCFVGGDMLNFGTNVSIGSAEWMVAEIDESDGSHLLFSPDYAVITNIEEDHLDYYHSLEDIKNRFHQFLDGLKPDAVVIYGMDCPNLRDIMAEKKMRKISYGFDSRSDVRAQNAVMNGSMSSYQLFYHGQFLGEVRLQVPGRHNISNSLAALGFLLALNIPVEAALGFFPQFRGAKRRLEVKWNDPEIMVIDDYAHHPTEVRAGMEALRQYGRGITAVFQPHRYSRVLALAEDFGKAFAGADRVILTEIYAAGEKNPGQVDSGLIEQALRRAGHEQVLRINKEDVITYLHEHGIPGGIVAFLGAGDITAVAEEFARSLGNSARKAVSRE